MTEIEAPGLRETARRILESEAAQFGVSLEAADVRQRLARGGTTMHVMAAGDELVRHLAATEADPLAEDSPLMVLARAGALALVSRVEVAGSAQAQPVLLIGERQLDDRRCQRERRADHDDGPDLGEAEKPGEPEGFRLPGRVDLG
jgi:hypothetical protein